MCNIDLQQLNEGTIKMSIQEKLREILGDTYGGPSLSIDRNKFVIYVWTDAPVGEDILSSGDTLEECIQNYLDRSENV
jgi:hypothetical protein